MPTRHDPRSEGVQPAPRTMSMGQQTILEQANAAAAAQANAGGPTTQDAFLQSTDLTTPELADDNMPPPAYGDIYGEIRYEKDDLDTIARVSDDGRVNIRINQLNRRLSQVFTPALRQHLQIVQEDLDSGTSSRPYISSDDGVPPPPPLNVAIHVVGSRGDVQPFIALGKVLKDAYGHRVRLATHPNFKDFVQDNGLEFYNIGGSPEALMAFMVKNPSLMPSFRSLSSGDVGKRRKDVAEYIQGCWRSCYEAGDGMTPGTSGDGISESTARPFVADCIIANPPSFAHIHCAEKLGIPLHIMFTMPWSPTQAFPHPLANIQASNADPQLTNYLSYSMIEVLSWQGLGDVINRFRAKCLGLDPVSLIWAPGMLQRLKVPHTYCWSPALIPKPKDWGPHISVSGFNFLDLGSQYTPTADFQAFLDAGSPPVYIGFGSIVLDDSNAMTELILEAVKQTGQRVLLSKGWGDIGANDVPDSVFMLGNVPHDWLFKHVSCVVHHGGAGTTAAGIAAGRPTCIVPFFGDQPFWGAMIARAGAGPSPIPHKQLTANKLADAINFCLKSTTLERAIDLASKIATERGNDAGAQSFHHHLDVDRLRCTLTPSRSAAWRLKRTQVKLSPFAACTLANAGLLDFHDLKLFRPQEYETEEGPWDPISGGFVAACTAFSGMANGLAELPSETWKAAKLPFRPNRQQSQASMPTVLSQRELSITEDRSTSSTSPKQSQTSLNSPSKPSGLSSPASNIRSSSTSEPLQGQSSPNQNGVGRSRVRSGFEAGSGKDQMRHSGAHGSKGAGRFAKALVKSPMELSMSFTKGFHNLPKLWGDETVRPQPQVSDFKSGARVAGKEFGLGWYDGVTGLVTQPWKGAQKAGASGFLKGVGKGMGGFVAKPGAGALGILGYTMKGVHKEVQKLFDSNVQSYIITSRTAQGYEEWLRSSDAEKQAVVVRWKLIQKYLKKRRNREEMMQGILEAQQKTSIENNETGCTTTSGHSASADVPERDAAGDMLSMAGSLSSEESLSITGSNESIQLPVHEKSQGHANDDADVARAIQENESRLQRQRQETADRQADQDDLLRAMAVSKIEAQRRASEALEFEKQLKQILEQSLDDQTQSISNSERGSNIRLSGDDDEALEAAGRRSGEMTEKMPAMSGGPLEIQRSLLHDQGHLEGTTQSEFRAQLQGRTGEKTTQEMTEEQIVMEYVKKQSLLEGHHRNKGKGRVTATEDNDDEDLQQALKLSTSGDGYGEASRT